MSTIIYPTGTCFDDALDLMEHFILEDCSKIETLILVHAICLQPDGPEEGTPFAHAWLEEGDVMWQAGILGGDKIQYSCSKAEMVAALRVQDLTRYTAHQVRDENQRSGTYGPWLPQYQALTKSPSPDAVLKGEG